MAELSHAWWFGQVNYVGSGQIDCGLWLNQIYAVVDW